MLRTLTELSQMEGRTYVYIENEELMQHFIQQAEKEGFTYCDGAKLTERFPAYVMALNPDKTINFVGMNGRTAWQTKTKTIGGVKFNQIRYKDYI